MTIQELLRDHGIQFASHGEHHHARPEWIAVKNCPFCGSSNYHLGWSLRARFFNCWKCGGHKTFATLAKLGIPFEKTKAFFDGSGPRLEKVERTGLKEPPGRIGMLEEIHREYLRDRGFNPAEIKRVWEIESINHMGFSLAWRIYIPILDHGQRVSWTTRKVTDGSTSPRYLSAPASMEAVAHKELVYGRDMCRHSVVIVEGPTDAWRIGPGAGALFGVSYTPAQLLALSKIPNRFVCFDSSPDAQRKAKILAAELSLFPGRTVAVELDSPDPGSASKKEVNLIRKMAGLD